jgi:hypothetical protein
MPGDTTLIRRGAISGAIVFTIASITPPTDVNDTWPGLARRAGSPLTTHQYNSAIYAHMLGPI